MHPCAGRSAIANWPPLCCLPAKILRVTCLAGDVDLRQSTTIDGATADAPPSDEPRSRLRHRGTTTPRRSRVVIAVVRKAPPTARRDPTARWSRPTPEATPRGAQSRPGDRSAKADRPARKINTHGLTEKSQPRRAGFFCFFLVESTRTQPEATDRHRQSPLLAHSDTPKNRRFFAGGAVHRPFA